jgi:CRP-like cAMP-binding protein
MPESEKNTLIRLIRDSSPLFSRLESEHIGALLDIGRTTKVESGQMLFRKGDEPDRFFVIVTGSARAVVPSHDGRDLVLRLMGPGDVFGEIAALDGEARTADVITTEACELLIFERNRFKQYMLERPEVATELVAVLARRLRTTTELLTDNVFLGVPARLAKVLLGLARGRTPSGPEKDRIDIEYSQQELADMTGTSRVSINKQLRAWEDLGLVSIKRRLLTILDIEGLEDCAEVGL